MYTYEVTYSNRSGVRKVAHTRADSDREVSFAFKAYAVTCIERLY